MSNVARIVITPKEGVLDPQGKTVQRSLQALGYEGIEEVRMGKFVEIRFDASDPPSEIKIREMCDRLLANPVVEEYRIELG
jgi:phosphoribosylformylglycinamidine synthase